MRQSEESKLMGHLIDLQRAGVSLTFQKVSRNESSIIRMHGTIKVGMYNQRIVVIAPEKDVRGVQLNCEYFEGNAKHPLMGPRIVSFSHHGTSSTNISLSNNIEYRILRRHCSKLPFAGDYERILEQGKEVDYEALEALKL